jgi:tetratricopeptide (TPR) repeat protein
LYFRTSSVAIVVGLVLLVVVVEAQGPAATGCRADLAEGLAYFVRYDRDPENIDRALAAYDRAADDPACAYEAHWRAADAHLCWGTTLEGKKKRITQFQNGVRRAQMAIAADPSRPEGHHFYAVNLGSIVETGGMLRHVRKIKKVIRAMEDALAADPDFVPALVVEAQFNLDMPGLFGGDMDKAKRALDRAMAADPRYEMVYLSLAKYHRKRKEYDKALEFLDRLEAMTESDHACLACYRTIDKPNAKRMRAEILEKMR